jgi:hypothetical protein
MLHLVSNHVVDLDGDTANGTMLCTARVLQANAAAGTAVVHVVRYVDRYERRQGRWRILDRQVRILWSEQFQWAALATWPRSCRTSNPV